MSDQVAIALLTGAGFTVTNVITVYFAYKSMMKQSKETHVLVNSRMSQLVKRTEDLFLARGMAQEKAEEQARKDDAKG